METAYLRNPHAIIREEILCLGLEQEEDEPLFDQLDKLTHKQALLVYEIIMMMRVGGGIVCAQVMKNLLIDSGKRVSIITGNTTFH